MGYIMGKERSQINLLPECIEDYVEENNPVRVIDAYVNSLDLDGMSFTHGQPNETGRPPYSPYDMLKLYIYGYMNRVRSSRRLEAETVRNLEVIWLIGKLRPDHKTIARFRHDNPEALKQVFRQFVKLCVGLGLYGRELVAIDGSKFKAVNSGDRIFTEKKLREKIARMDAKIEAYHQEMDEADRREDTASTELTKEAIAAAIASLSKAKTDCEGYARALSESEETQIALTDPDCRLMKSGGRIEPCYNIQTSVDSKNKLLVDFEVTNNALDKNNLAPMATRSAELLEVENLTAVADTGYDCATDIADCVMNGIEPHVAGVDITVCIPTDEPQSEITSHVNGRAVYLPDRNIAICPMGKPLYPSSYRKKPGDAVFINGRACSKCTCRCIRGRQKEFTRAMPFADFHKEYDDSDLFVRQVRITPSRRLVRLRKTIVEHPFGTVKQAMDSRHCLLKGLRFVRGEFSLAFLSYNLKRVINIMGVPNLITTLQV